MFQSGTPLAQVLENKHEPVPLDALAKAWLQLLVQSGRLKRRSATLSFPRVLAQTTSTIHVSVSASLLRLSPAIGPVKTCRCHGAILGSPLLSGSEVLCCPVTAQHLDERDCDSDSVQIGADTVLHMPPTRDTSGSRALATSHSEKMEIQVVKLINLSTLDEVLLFGDPLTVTASSDLEFDPMTGMDPLIWNEKVFLSVCEALQDLDNGLFVRSKYLVDSGEESPLPQSYLLTPSGEGSLLMRLEVCDYSPFEHERGIHQKVSEMVNSSVSFSPMDGLRFTSPGCSLRSGPRWVPLRTASAAEAAPGCLAPQERPEQDSEHFRSTRAAEPAFRHAPGEPASRLVKRPGLERVLRSL
ncbi:hypothetical protein KFL_005280040 [Klebsormidium nitens]|uniref:Uncharacterized protein n=1 Tax=Klebsormidium nitens TaxID=105231 RepID=A0A1Y1IF05_KLENI|nr:hypothetical protein KFL_005280040 [Klebsormidium nitens]|eukprot:GAQ89484.1 hypothetical protein KFL_005280040 [Klebsormidium nitens]